MGSPLHGTAQRTKEGADRRPAPRRHARRMPALVRDLREAGGVLMLMPAADAEREALLKVLLRHGLYLVAAGRQVDQQPGREAMRLQHGIALGVADLHLHVAEEAAVGSREDELHGIAGPARIVAALLRYAGA